MLFIAIAEWRENITQEQYEEALAKWAEWKAPEGVNVLGEYFTGIDSPTLIMIFEASEFKQLRGLTVDFEEYLFLAI